MRANGGIGNRIGRQHVIAVGLALLVALAGCSAIVSDDSENGDTGESIDKPASAIVANASAATEDIETYRTTADWDLTIASPNGESTVQATVNTSVDRADQQLKVVQEAAGPAGTATSETYIVDETLYQHSAQLSRTYGSEWVKLDISQNFTQQFRQNDELGSQRVMLTNASVTTNRTETIDGQETYRLEADVNETALNVYYGFDETELGVDNATTTVWVSTDTNRIVRTKGTISQSVTAQGQTVQTTIDYDTEFVYEDVRISLPEEASSAVDIEQDPTLVN